MAILIKSGDVLDSKSEAILLTVDGMKLGLEGNVARQFARRYPEDWKYLQRDIKYPIPLGRSLILPWEGDCLWSHVLIASTLHHVSVLTDDEKLRVIRQALSEALRLCVRYGVRSLSTVVLSGGWRLSPEAALHEMEQTYRLSACPMLDLQVWMPVGSQAATPFQGHTQSET